MGFQMCVFLSLCKFFAKSRNASELCSTQSFDFRQSIVDIRSRSVCVFGLVSIDTFAVVHMYNLCGFPIACDIHVKFSIRFQLLLARLISISISTIFFSQEMKKVLGRVSENVNAHNQFIVLCVACCCFITLYIH